jgi:hypothetical protein
MIVNQTAKNPKQNETSWPRTMLKRKGIQTGLAVAPHAMQTPGLNGVNRNFDHRVKVFLLQ